MKMDEILNFIKEMSESQGFYGRLYRTLIDIKENDKDAYDEISKELESQNFNDMLDIVMYLEG